MRLFADTYFFISLGNLDDPSHKQSKTFSTHPRLKLVTSEWVLVEVADGFAARRGREHFATLVRGLRALPNVEVIPSGHDAFVKAFDFYVSRPDKEWSLTDCTSSIIMRDLGISDALTADHHFEQAGFTALLK